MLTVAELAAAKGFLPEELALFGVRDGDNLVEIPYHLADGTEFSRMRLRFHLIGKEGSRWRNKHVVLADGLFPERWMVCVRDSGPYPDGFVARFDTKREAENHVEKIEDELIPYGLYQPIPFAASVIPGLFIVEGETDSWALWTSGIAALGMPGASNFRRLKAQHVDGVQDVHVIQEPGEAGGRFPHAIMLALYDTGFTGQVYAGPMLDGYKDPQAAFAALQHNGFDEFVALMKRVVAGMTLMPRPAPVAVALVRSSPKPAGDALAQHFSQPADSRRYSTGNHHLDKIVGGGFYPSEQTVVAARSNMGKSGLIEDWGLEMSHPKYAPDNKALYFALEMRVLRTERRMLAKLLKTSENWVQHLQESKLLEDKQILDEKIAQLRTHNLHMVAPRTDEEFDMETIIELILEQKPNVVFIDQLRSIHNWGVEGRLMRDQAIGKSMRRLKAVGEEHGFHTVLAHQLKLVKVTKGQRPAEDDLADGAPIYQTADTVIAVHRPFIAFPERDYIAELIPLKNRRGKRPWVHTHFTESISFPRMEPEEEHRAICCKAKEEARRASTLA